MNRISKMAIVAAAATFVLQPALAQAAQARSAPLAATAASSAGERIQFDLKRHSEESERQVGGEASALGTGSSTAALQTTAPDENRRKGPSTATWIIIGGVILGVVLLAAVASAAPSPGPHEGAFD